MAANPKYRVSISKLEAIQLLHLINQHADSYGYDMSGITNILDTLLFKIDKHMRLPNNPTVYEKIVNNSSRKEVPTVDQIAAEQARLFADLQSEGLVDSNGNSINTMVSIPVSLSPDDLASNL